MGTKAALAAALISPHSVAAAETYFEANRGQADASVAFVARGPGYAVLLQRNGSAGYRFPAGADGDAQLPLRIELPGQRAPAAVEGEQPMASVTNYYRGSHSADWHSGIPHYGRVRFAGVYPGIDLIWRTRGADLEYEFLASAGADPTQIRVRFSGASRVSIDAQGNLDWRRPPGEYSTGGSWLGRRLQACAGMSGSNFGCGERRPASGWGRMIASGLSGSILSCLIRLTWAARATMPATPLLRTAPVEYT